MDRVTFKDLAGLSAKQLQDTANRLGLGLRFNKSHTKADMRKRILAAQAEREAEAVEAANDPTPGDKLDANDAFERLCDGVPDAAADVPFDVPDNRGGARPGAGRPPGMTAEIAAYNRLAEQPHPAIQDAFELLFDSWAAAAKCPGLKLTKQEAFDIALPWTNVLELMGVAQRIPFWVTVAITCAWNTLAIVKAKAALARQAKQNREGKDHAETTSTVVAA